MKKEKKKASRKVTSKQVVALISVLLLLLMYIITLITAIADNSASAKWFRISLSATLAIPLIIWIYTWMYARLTGKHAVGDPDNAAVLPEGTSADSSGPLQQAKENRACSAAEERDRDI